MPKSAKRRASQPTGAETLVVVESPAKARSIQKMLGPGYEVRASLGHVVDLPERSLGVDVERDFAPTYEVKKDKKPQMLLVLSLVTMNYMMTWLN